MSEIGRLLISDSNQGLLLTKWLILIINSNKYECLDAEDFSFFLLMSWYSLIFFTRLKLCL